MSSVEGSVVLVTGANRGIGKAYVEEFLKEGAAKIYLAVRNLESVSDFVSQDTDRLVPLKLDVTSSEDIKNAVDVASDVTILINNAGVLHFDDVTSENVVENARDHIEVNYIGPLAITHAFAPVLKNNGGGILITVSSIVGHVSMPAITTYCASKYAVQSMILNSRAILTSQGTRVMGVYPGPIDTDMAADLPMDKVPASQVAVETIKAIESGAEDVFPDAFAQNLYDLQCSDPKEVERQMRSSITEEAA
jgi:NAD(P)-dependent dehydrogenase (short-subunit alcohol dehydrogenase family)